MIHKNIQVDKVAHPAMAAFMDHIQAFQTKFLCVLPDDFIAFLQHYSGAYLTAEIELSEPNPLGNIVGVQTIFGFCNDSSFEDIRENTEIGDGYPAAIPFASDYAGNWFYLYLGPSNKDSKVLFYDLQHRDNWSDEEFHNRYANLAPEIAHYLEKRKKGLLPQKEKKFRHFYEVSNTFDVFMKKLKPERLDL